MKKLLLALLVLFVLTLAACGSSSDDEKDDKAANDPVKIKVGASSTPHAEILEEAEPLLKEEGIELEIEQYQDFVFPNDDLENGELDANYFQHIPYLEETVESKDYDLVNIGGIHIEPMGIYSQDIKSLDDLKDGTEVIMSKSVSDHGRILTLFEKEGFITLEEDVDKENATLEDIDENKQDLQFKAEVEPGFLPEIYRTEKDVLVAINTNYAIDADLNPMEDALIIEADESPYVNIIAARTEDEDRAELKTLVEVLHTKEIQDFIIEKYEGAVVPVDGK